MGNSGAGLPAWFRFPHSCRITQAREIQELLRKGKRKKTSHLDVFFLSSRGSRSRLGFVVPKHRHRVVDRNKVKRRLREIGRKEVLPVLETEGVKVRLLIRARREAYEASYQVLQRELSEVTKELCSRRFSSR